MEAFTKTSTNGGAPRESRYDFSPTNAQTYRTEFRLAMELAKQFDGKESSSNILMEHLIALDRCISRICKLPENRSVSESLEIFVNRCLLGSRQPCTIAGIIELAQESLILRVPPDATPLEIAESLGIFHKEVDAALARPMQQTISQKSGGEEGASESRWLPRIQILLTTLQKIGVYTDDIILKSSPESGSKWRYPGYALIEIPRADFLQLFISNQVGEGTRIGRRPLSVTAYQNLTKDELDRIPGVATVVCQSLEQWQSKISELISRQRVSAKIDVALVEWVREAITKKFTPGSFLALNVEDVDYIEMGDVLFGEVRQEIRPDAANLTRSGQLKWAEIIFGANQPAIQHAFDFQTRLNGTRVDYLNYDGDWKARVRQHFPTEDLFSAYVQGNDRSKPSTAVNELLYSLGFNYYALHDPVCVAWIGSAFKSNENTQRPNLMWNLAGDFPVKTLRECTVALQQRLHLGCVSPRSGCFLRILHESLSTEIEYVLNIFEEVSSKSDSRGRVIELPSSHLSKDMLSRWSLAARRWVSLGEKPYVSKHSLLTLRRARHELFEVGAEIEAYQSLLRDRIHSREVRQQYPNGVDCFTPLSVRPEWDLEHDEAMLLQLLANDGALQYSRIEFLSAMFDPEAKTVDEMWRGPTAKIAQSVIQKTKDTTLYDIIRVGDLGIGLKLPFSSMGDIYKLLRDSFANA